MERGRSSASGAVVVYAFGRGDSAPPRYCLVVGRRWGGAVERNVVRRRLRESFRLFRASLPSGFDYALTPRSSVAAAPFDAIGPALAAAGRSAARKFTAEGPRPPKADPPAKAGPAPDRRDGTDGSGARKGVGDGQGPPS